MTRSSRRPPTRHVQHRRRRSHSALVARRWHLLLCSLVQLEAEVGAAVDVGAANPSISSKTGALSRPVHRGHVERRVARVPRRHVEPARGPAGAQLVPPMRVGKRSHAAAIADDMVCSSGVGAHSVWVAHVVPSGLIGTRTGSRIRAPPEPRRRWRAAAIRTPSTTPCARTGRRTWPASALNGAMRSGARARAQAVLVRVRPQLPSAWNAEPPNAAGSYWAWSGAWNAGGNTSLMKPAASAVSGELRELLQHGDVALLGVGPDGERHVAREPARVQQLGDGLLSRDDHPPAKQLERRRPEVEQRGVWAGPPPAPPRTRPSCSPWTRRWGTPTARSSAAPSTPAESAPWARRDTAALHEHGGEGRTRPAPKRKLMKAFRPPALSPNQEHALGVAAERADVALHPHQRPALVGDGVVPPRP